MGNISGRILRPFKNYNIENRAHKEILKDKPTTAPTYKTTKTLINLVNEIEPDYKVTSQIKNAKLDNYLKEVYIKSEDSKLSNDNLSENPDKPLPQERLRPEFFEYGFRESAVVEKGKISLRKAIEMIDKHSKDPKTYTSLHLSKEYCLEQKLVDNILEYFLIFKLNKIEDTNVASNVKVEDKLLETDNTTEIKSENSVNKNINVDKISQVKCS